MKNKSESLERKSGKPDWKQWIPVYGAYRMVKDHREGKPTLADDSPWSYFASIAYHAGTGFFTVNKALDGLAKLVENI